MATLLIVPAVAAGSTTFHGPGFEGVPRADTAFNVTVENTTPVSSPRMRYRELGAAAWHTCDLTDFACVLDDGLDQGVYEYVFINGTNTSTRFPANGTLRLAVSDGVDRWQRFARNLTDTDPANDNFGASCTPWTGDFACGYEDMQGAMIDAFGLASLMTGNDTYTGKAENLSLQEYDTTGDSPGTENHATCDINNSDFDCSNESIQIAVPPPSGSLRQSFLISGLSRTGRLLALPNVSDAGRDYMGGSASDCDVWDHDYDCVDPVEQGHMTAAAWDAFIASGNTTVRGKAENLSAVAYEDVRAALNTTGNGTVRDDLHPLVSGLLRAAMVTGNTSYRSAAADLAEHIGRACVNETGASPCGVEDQAAALSAMVGGYRITGEHRYHQYAAETARTNVSGACNPWNASYTCSHADDQGTLAASYWAAFQILPDVSPRFHAPRIEGTRSVGGTLRFTVGMTGYIQTPRIFLRKRNTTDWHTCTLPHANGTCAFNGSVFNQQTTYEYLFNASNTSLPRNGTFTVLIGVRNQSLRGYAENLTRRAPVSPNQCDPVGGSFHCLRTDWQGWMMHGMQSAEVYGDNQTYERFAATLGTVEYDPTDSSSSCDQADGDFSCDPGDDPPGSVRQGRIITSLWDTYRRTRNDTLRRIAANYTRDQPADCQVHDNDHVCANDRGQGTMLNAYLDAYTATGNTSYLDTAGRLAGPVLDDPNINQSVLINGLWRFGGITSNATVTDTAANHTGAALDACTDGSCSVLSYANAFSAGITAFERSGNDTYYNRSFDVFTSGPTNSCDAWTGDLTCDDPDEQAAMMRTFWTGFATTIKQVDGSVTLNLTKTSMTTGDTFNATCTVTNTVPSGADLLSVNVTVSSSLITHRDNRSQDFGTITPLASSNGTWRLEASSTGTDDVTCTAEATNGWTGSATTAVTVSAPSSGSDGGGDGGGGGGGSDGSTGGGGFVPGPTVTTYDFDNRTGIAAIEDRMAAHDITGQELVDRFNTTENGVDRILAVTRDRAAAGCFTATRSVPPTFLRGPAWLNVSDTCTATPRLLLADRVPANVSSIDAVTTIARPVFTTDAAVFLAPDTPIRVRYGAEQADVGAFHAPLLLAVPRDLPRPDTRPPRITASTASANRSGDFAVFRVNLSDATTVRCEVQRNGEQVTVFSRPRTVNVSLVEGRNRITYNCSDAAGNAVSGVLGSVVHEGGGTTEEPRTLVIPSIPPTLILAALISVLMAAGFARRQALLQHWWRWRRDRLLARFDEELAAGDMAAVLDLYDKVRASHTALHGELPEMGFWRGRVDELGRTLRLYILLDISIRKLDRGTVEPVRKSAEPLRNLYQRWLDDTDDEELEQRMQEKLSRFEERLAWVSEGEDQEGEAA